MRYSDWQLKRIRDALRAYHRYGGDKMGERFNWKDVSEAISLYTDAEVPSERLRQFVEGINTPEGRRKHPVPAKERLEGIVRFVTDEQTGLLSKAELEERLPQFQAPLRLLEYLDQDFDTNRMHPPQSLQGNYRNSRIDQDEFVITEITLQKPSEDGLIQVSETHDFFHHLSAERFDKWSVKDKEENRSSRVKYAGWAILTPEDNLLFFMKNELNGRNHSYLVLETESGFWSEGCVQQLTFLHHDYPYELTNRPPDNQELTKQLLVQIHPNIRCFNRSDQLE